jgi:hypothetical protein
MVRFRMRPGCHRKDELKTLVVFSDGHTNSTVGLAKPTVKLDEGDQVSASTVRRWVFWTYNDTLETVAKKAKGEIYGLLNGDMVELDAKARSIQLITRNQEEAIGMACEVWEPFFQMCKGVYSTRGTEAHTGPNSQADDALAANFENTIRNPETEKASWWWLPLELDGVRMDIAHHPKGGGSGRPMNSQGGIDRIASDALFNYANDGESPPHLVIRSHLHGYRDSRDAFRTRAIITPAMSLLTSYTYRIGINVSNPIGAIMIYCHNGEYFVEPILRKVAKPQWQIVP